MDYISVQQAAEKWGVSERWVQKLCEENRITGAIRGGLRGQSRKTLKNRKTDG